MRLKILLWNLQDFFVFMDKYKGEDLSKMPEQKWQLLSDSIKINKPLDKVRDIQYLIQKVDPDICLFTEVGGKESLESFNQHFLRGSYQVLHHSSNSDRGIDLGCLAKLSSQYSIKSKFHSHKVFARGVQQIDLQVNNFNLSFLLTHLKSKLNLRKEDFEGRSQRLKEVEKLTQITKDLQRKQQKEVIITGDLNGVIYKADTEQELAPFAQNLGLFDVLEHLDRSIFDRATYIYYNRLGQETLMQLDYFLMSKELAKCIAPETKVLSFEGEHRVNIPKDRQEKMAHPSDHYPLYLELILNK